NGCGGHAARIKLIPVDPLGIFAEGALHGRLPHHHHVVHPAAGGFDEGEGTAQDVGAAGAGAHAGDAAISRQLKGVIQGVNAVDGAQVGRPDVVHLVIVDACHAGAVAVHADVGMGVHKAGVDLEIGDVDDL